MRRKTPDFSKGVRGKYFGRQLKFECAPTDLIAQLDDYAREFFSDVLEMSFDDCLVTDESELHHFLTDETPDDYAERFREKYGLELSDVGSDIIVRILARIANMREQPNPN